MKWWDTATGRLLRTFEDSPAGILSVALSPDGSRLLAGTMNGELQLWDLPKEICSTWMVRGSDGRTYARQSCHPDPRTASALAAAQAANNQLNEADTRLTDAKNRRASLDQNKTDANVADAKLEFRRAVLASTLHMLAGVWFRKPAIDVSDDQLNTALLFLVVVTSAAVAFSGQALAILSVRRLTTPRESATQYVSGLERVASPAIAIIIKRSDTIDRVIDLFRAGTNRDAFTNTQVDLVPGAASSAVDRGKTAELKPEFSDNDNNVNSHAS
jgi:hypothetical protein